MEENMIEEGKAYVSSGEPLWVPWMSQALEIEGFRQLAFIILNVASDVGFFAFRSATTFSELLQSIH